MPGKWVQTWLPRWASRWFVSKDGTTAIEFALLAVPYFMLCIAIIEMSIMFTAAALLETATSRAARLLRTGEIQQSSNDPAAQEQAFRQALCAQATALIPCSEIVIEAVDMGGFGNYDTYAPQFDADGNMVSQGFSPGGSRDTVLVRAAFRYRFMTPLIGFLLGENGTPTRQFFSTIVLQAEPYDFQDDS